ncbi:lysine N(6)-hydroxylase/L-ornithine N(5)-oxygenase family protein [Streptomyces sp. CBMA156]|uniref:lysine N(6)-hydroxylase/L-ornithine N(5)-oxygenase family protein n=1 Tax=Streptomyces sp. CBMA156 TaxID=1930280 RepID=UPI001661CF13|nr:SidA/IucD/PvdA family monooxygenase [Streptomyces sp. CBMA156]MBD0669410.1 L-lysine 6-monooxygenase [Streptomyces sp. CBMA156]
MGPVPKPTTASGAAEQPSHLRLVGIGAGPANLSLAALLHGDPEQPNLFLDRKPSFTWHDDQLITGATLQVSIFKDLVSLSDPTNRFSFLSYLHEHGRMYHFLNAQFAEVPRTEFRNYLAWAAETNENVAFSETVERVDFDGVFRVTTDRRQVTADNIAVGVGTVPWVPDYAVPHLGAGHLHVSQYLRHAKELAGKRVAVIGGGQSGAEAFLDLISRSDAERPAWVSWVSRRRNYFPIDDSTFTNDFYMPEYSEYFYRLSESKRAELNSAHLLSSDGISESTLRAIYQVLYRLQFIERDEHRFGLLPNRNVVSADRTASGTFEVMLRHNDESGQSECLPVDAVVWATGFRPAPKTFLEPLMGRIETENGEVRVNEDFAVSWDGPPDRNIFMQNAVRGQRGLPDVNLSLNAWRAQRIVNSLRGSTAPELAMSFIDWSAKSGRGTQWTR